jgi:choline dehydrogenase-like flavoprotein
MKSTETSPSAQIVKKSQPEEFDLVILGGGTGSTIAAWMFAGEGKRVAVVDRKCIGGSCPNIACLPSKNTIHLALAVSDARHLNREAAFWQNYSSPVPNCATMTPHPWFLLPKEVRSPKRSAQPDAAENFQPPQGRVGTSDQDSR